MKHRRRTIRDGAFTIVELIVGVVVIAILAAATTGAMNQLVRTRAGSVAHRQAFARASDAAWRIAMDLSSAARDADLQQARVRVVSGGDGANARDEVLMLMRSLRPVRGLASVTGFAEGDEYEVQYRVVDDRAAQGGTLWRRADPSLDGKVDAGGVASPVIPGVASLSVTAYDGVSWYDVWDSDEDGMPHAVRVEVVAVSDDGRAKVTARRVVALDRVPLYPPEEEESSSSSESGGSTP